MKKLAVSSSLAAALWLNGAAEAQSPFFQSPAQPVQALQPVAARTAPAAQMPPGGVVPVRVHFGGALTRDGVVPVHLYTNQPMGRPAAAPAATTITRVQHEALQEPSRKAFPPPPVAAGDTGAAKPSNITDVFVNHEASAPEIHDHRFVAPDVEHMRRPRREPCGYRWYTSAEYLHWWTRPIDSPVLLLVNGAPVTANDIDATDRQGARLTIGKWLGHHHSLWGIEGSVMFTGTRRASNNFASNGVTALEHPFIDAATGAPATLPVATDAGVDPRSGSSEIETASRMFGFEVNLRRELCRTSCGHLDLLLGYRQFHLDEAIAIRDRVVYDAGAAGPLSGATVIGVDEFGTHNRIFAGQIGIDGELNWRKFYVGAWGKFALGSNEETINVSGWTHVRPGGDFAGSVYTQPSNIGHYQDSQLTVLPEVGAHVGYKITSNWRVGAGYNFLYINNVVRPGDAIDTTISPGQIPQLQPLGPVAGVRPAPPTFIESAYWAHGLTVHMEIRY